MRFGLGLFPKYLGKISCPPYIPMPKDRGFTAVSLKFEISQIVGCYIVCGYTTFDFLGGKWGKAFHQTKARIPPPIEVGVVDLRMQSGDMAIQIYPLFRGYKKMWCFWIFWPAGVMDLNDPIDRWYLRQISYVTVSPRASVLKTTKKANREANPNWHCKR